MAKARAWCFTLNNYTEEEVEHIKDIDCKYLIFGKEVGEKGTPHLQGYIEFTNPRSMSGVKKALNNRVHLETRRGTSKEAADYCKKEDKDAFEKGKISNPGERTDLTELKEKILNGTKLDDIIVDDFELYCRYRNGIKDLVNVVQRKKKRTEMTEGFWYYGPTGVGKSHKAFKEAGDDHYLLTNDNGWWDGYEGQETVIINDFRGNIEYGMLLQLIDKWPMKVKRRGQEPMPFTSKKVIITSSLPPEGVYCNLAKEDSLDQLYRRIKCFYVCCKDGTEVHHGNTEHGVCEKCNKTKVSGILSKLNEMKEQNGTGV